jgi:hypothetical protein
MGGILGQTPIVVKGRREREQLYDCVPRRAMTGEASHATAGERATIRRAMGGRPSAMAMKAMRPSDVAILAPMTPLRDRTLTSSPQEA